MRITLDLNSIDDYALFLKIKALPAYRFVGREAIFADEYADRLGIERPPTAYRPYVPMPWLFDYQRDITALAIQKRKYATFVECGYGKQNILFEYARYVESIMPKGRAVLLVSPLMVIEQAMGERAKFYGDSLPIEVIKSRDVNSWLATGTSRIGITNYEAFTNPIDPGRLFALELDESSLLASSYGKWGQEIIRIGRGLDWKLAATGTPAPNDRIEYANHAVFLDAFPTVNSFLARYFVNRGQTDNRWEIKPHALTAFYRELSHWCLFLSNPGVYGWKDNATAIPPIHVHIHDVDLTSEQHAAAQAATGQLIVTHLGGITQRSKLAQISRGNHNGEEIPTNKLHFIQSLVASWPDESTIIWCRFNPEQEAIAKAFPDAGSIMGATPYEDRVRLIEDFKAGRRKVLIGKPKTIGLGLNLQIATRQIISGISDSWQDFHQCVKRSNRVGSKYDLNVHVPVTELERPFMDNILRKADRIDRDNHEQEALFRAAQTR